MQHNFKGKYNRYSLVDYSQSIQVTNMLSYGRPVSSVNQLEAAIYIWENSENAKKVFFKFIYQKISNEYNGILIENSQLADQKIITHNFHIH